MAARDPLNALRERLADLEKERAQVQEEMDAAISKREPNKNIIYFYGRECSFTKRAEPLVRE